MCGDSLTLLRDLPEESIQCCITSPPYWGLRDYGIAGQLGMESTPEEYVSRMVEVFREVRRVLRKDGTLWLNIGDSYAQNGSDRSGGHDGGTSTLEGGKTTLKNSCRAVGNHGLKPKDLVGIPWRLAFALQADGWYLRCDIIWSKPNPMPESVTDRPTKAHEYIFLLTKSARYYYDADAIREPYQWPDGPNSPESIKSPYGQGFTRAASHKGSTFNNGKTAVNQQYRSSDKERIDNPSGRNKRSVWSIATEPFPEAHFATFPGKLVEPCILAGSKAGDMVLDPFCGSGTVGIVATGLQRKFIGIELNPKYVEMAERRIKNAFPLLAVNE